MAGYYGQGETMDKCEDYVYVDSLINARPKAFGAHQQTIQRSVGSAGLGCSTRQPEVPRLLDQTDKQLAALNERLQMLEERLRPIVRDVPAANNVGSQKDTEPIQTPIGDRLNDFSQRVDALNYRIDRILSQLEV